MSLMKYTVETESDVVGATCCAVAATEAGRRANPTASFAIAIFVFMLLTVR